MRRQALLCIVALTVLGCGNGNDAVTEEERVTTTATTATTTAVTTVVTTGFPAGSCEVGDHSPPSDDWEYLKFTDLFSSDFLFFLPSGWVDHPPGEIPAEDAFHPENLDEAGLSADTAIYPIRVTHPAQLPGVILFTLDGITSTSDVVHARQEAHYQAGTGSDVEEILRTGMTTCLGGEPALGVEMVLDGGIHTQSWTTVRAGTLYHLVLVADDQAQADLFEEILGSWAWDEDAVEAAAQADAAAAAATIDTGWSCEADPPTGMSAGWSPLQADDFAFSHPSDWEDMSGAVTLMVSGFLDEETFAETELPVDARFASTLVRDASGFPNVSVLRFEGVSSPLGEVHTRLLAHLGGLPEVEGLAPIVGQLCVGGEPAAALDLLFSPDPDGEEPVYQQNWYVVRAETLYQIQLLTEKAEDAAIFHELLRTWEWASGESESPTGDSEGVAGGVFVEAHMASEADTSQDSPDRTKFTSTFARETTRVHVVFRLEPGASGQVDITWKREGEVILQSNTYYSEDTQWASASVYYSGGEALEPGSYEVELEAEESGDRVVVPFTVAGP